MTDDSSRLPPADEGAAKRRQLIRLAVQRRPEITVAGLHRAMRALDMSCDDDILRADLASLGIHVQHDPNGNEALGGPGMATILQPDLPEPQPEEPPDRNRFSLRNPAAVAAIVVGLVLVAILVGVLVFRDPSSESHVDAGGPTTAATVTTPSTAPTTTKPKPIVAPTGPGSDPALATGATVDTFDRTGEGLGSLPGGNIYLVGAGTWRTESGHALLAQPNPGGPSVVFTEIGTADVRAQVTLVSVTEGAGIAFRVVDRRNYWLWVASPHFGTASVIHVVDGKLQVLGNSGITLLQAPLRLGVNTSGSTIQLLANGAVVKTITDTSPKPGTAIGLGVDARGPAATFDDLTFIRG